MSPSNKDSADPNPGTEAGFEARIGKGETAFDARDAELLRAVDEHGSLNGAVEALGRSFAHAQRRVVALEESFGQLVVRHRGGAGGGGSELTDGARTLLARFDRLRAEFTGVAAAPQTVLPGTVTDRDGELVTVRTAIGSIRALAPSSVERVEVSIRADTVTLHSPAEPPADTVTSALNRFTGAVSSIELGESVATIELDLGNEVRLAALLTRASVDRLGFELGSDAVATFKATATRAIARRPRH